MKKIIYGCAYYDEYMPYERIDKDIEMMKKAGINTVRIAESTWSTHQPKEDVFDFSSVIKVMDRMEEAGIDVIIGTPTYAIPYWLAEKYPDILADTDHGKNIYGARQLMDITDPDYLKASETIIRKLMEVTAHRKCVIGFQADNETKYYDAASDRIQKHFVQYLKEKFHDDLKAMNEAYGLAYWSNRISDWDVFPDVRGSINGSLKAEFDRFRRSLVTQFLAWQADLIREYKRDDQFITHNFDFEWRGYSYGIQPQVNHFEASKVFTIAGCDIYHPSQDQLTGTEIAFCGDVTRSLKQDNYLVMETQAHGFPNWLPFDGQLKLQAFSHLASGANGVCYWHWHSIHNSAETYWMGILGHDFEENRVYDEVMETGNLLKKYGPHLVNLKKKNHAAILVSNDALSSLNQFPVDLDSSFRPSFFYNDAVRWMYDAFYRLNIECDFITPETEDISGYRIIAVPALYVSDENTLKRLDAFVKDGGVLIASFKTAYADENTKVWPDRKPHILHRTFGMHYNDFTFPVNTGLKGKYCQDEQAETFMELLKPDTAEVLVRYDHPSWGKYAAVTANHYGKGYAMYIGSLIPQNLLMKLLEDSAMHADIELPAERFPVIIRKGTNDNGKKICYVLNYSSGPSSWRSPSFEAHDLLQEKTIAPDTEITLEPWSCLILEY